MSKDLDTLDEEIRKMESIPDASWGDETAIKNVPAPFRGPFALLSLLPPRVRIFGLALFVALSAAALWKGVTL